MVNIKPIDLIMHKPIPPMSTTHDYETLISNFNIGLRGHVWHKKYYHKISCLRDLFGMSLAILLCRHGADIITLTGLGFIGWELCEIGENIARYYKPMIAYEHINFADVLPLKLYGWKVYVLHGVRTVVGIGLMMSPLLT